MAGARSHEDLIVWQLATELKLAIYALVQSGPIARDRELCDQLRRAGASAPRNIAEGFGRYLPGPFIQSLRIANGELREIQDALRDGCDRGYLTRDHVLPLHRLSIAGIESDRWTDCVPPEVTGSRRFRPTQRPVTRRGRG